MTTFKFNKDDNKDINLPAGGDTGNGVQSSRPRPVMPKSPLPLQPTVDQSYLNNEEFFPPAKESEPTKDEHPVFPIITDQPKNSVDDTPHVKESEMIKSVEAEVPITNPINPIQEPVEPKPIVIPTEDPVILEVPDYVQTIEQNNTRIHSQWKPEQIRKEQLPNDKITNSQNTIPEAVDPSPKKKGFMGKFSKAPKLQVRKRSKIELLRMFIVPAVAILVVYALYSMFLKPNFSLNKDSYSKITTVVKNNLGMTDFPEDRATSFVVGFANAYLNLDSTKDNVRKQELSKYVPDNLQSAIDLSSMKGGQKVVFGPVITGVENIDNNNAIFSVYAIVAPLTSKPLSPGIYANANNLIIQVPVYYTNKVGEAQAYQMAISAPPSFAPVLTKAIVPANNNPSNQWESVDTEIATAEFKTNLARYLAFWALSDPAGISTYTTPDATYSAKVGLGGKWVYKNPQTLEVSIQGNSEENPLKNPNAREATVSVVWNDSKNQDVSYKQSYRLIIKKQADGQWTVYDIGSMFKKRITDTVKRNYSK